MTSTLDVLKELFVYVPSAKIEAFKAAHVGADIESTDNYYFRVAFLGESGEIATHGRIYGTNTSSDLAAIQAALAGFLGEGASTVAAAIALVQEQVTANANAIDVLNGEGEGSVKKAVSDAIAAVVNGAPGTFDTLKEIADWIAEHGTEAVDLTARVAAIETAIGEKGADGKDSTGLYKEIEDAVKAEKERAEGAEGHLSDRIDALEAKTHVTSDVTAGEGNYISGIHVAEDGAVTIDQTELPELSVKEGSGDYVAVDDHEIEIKTVDIASTVGMVKNEDGTWSAGEVEGQVNGLVSAADVAAEIVNDEKVIAAALNEIVAVLSWEEYA